MPKIEEYIECQACKGTGVYVGMAERAGAAVVCRTCKGTGEYLYKFEYESFTGRKKRDGVSRVYLSSYGYCIAPEVLTMADGAKIDMQQSGVAYEAFLAGDMPGHVEELACPMLADQWACHNINGFVDRCHSLGCCIGGSIARCSNTKNKAACWERFRSAK